MAAEHEPMKEVRKNFKVSWYRCPVEQAKLKELTSRNDKQGLLQSSDSPMDVAVSGDGFFVVTQTITPTTGDAYSYTRGTHCNRGSASAQQAEPAKQSPANPKKSSVASSGSRTS